MSTWMGILRCQTRRMGLRKEDLVGEMEKWAKRKQKFRNAFARVYVGYRNHAYPKDELITGWSLTAVEALSPLRLVDTKAGFWRTVRMLERKTFTNHATTSPFFETTIRYLGGFLSAYAFSGEKPLLTLVDDLEIEKGSPTMRVFLTYWLSPLHGDRR
ncbi:glycoside hydrolase [Coprinopsis sp. MPI-PUGE-AT-0042]|nr:glycoside hydrolase [Coprinopsis sp. MPI-PUGE-AT-0042]